MNRRFFLHLAAATPLPLFAIPSKWKELPDYRIVDRAVSTKAEAHALPGPFPGRYVRVHSEDVLDVASNRIDAPTVQAMLSAGMRRLTGAADERDAWSRFISPNDVVGIKVNCSGAPIINSNPELVAAIIKNLLSVGVPAENIFIYDRFGDQMRIVNFEAHVPAGVRTVTAENGNNARGFILGYDPFTYVEVDFFGEDDTRSNLIRLVSDKFTKVINVPTLKEHRAAGVTGCLKNLAYGNFSNVARSHRWAKTNTYSFIGTLASVDTLRSRTVLNVADGIRSIWHGGPFCQSPRFLFYPKEIVVGTDPVAIDHHLVEMIEAKRREEGAVSLFDRSPEHVKPGPELDPNFNSFVREPGHVEYASTLGLGVFDKAKTNGEVVSL